MFGRWRVRLAGRPRRASTYFLIAVILLSAAGTFFLWRSGAEKVSAFTAKADLPAYHQITSADVVEAKVPRERLPERFVKDRAQLTGRYVVTSVRRGRVVSLDDLGPSLPANLLSDRRLVALPATTADTGVGMLARGDRVDLLLSSAVAESPRNAVLRDVVVLDIKQLANQSGSLSVVYAVRRSDEQGLLTAGGTAKVFILRGT